LRGGVLGRLVEMDTHGGLRWNVSVLIVEAEFTNSQPEMTVHTYSDFSGPRGCLIAI
jgi:hypothetical protein